MCGCDEDDYEPDWQPVPGQPEWRYDANFGEWREGLSARTGLPLVKWRDVYRGEDRTNEG